MRTISRILRLTRFLATAVCECRGTMMPTRGPSIPVATVRSSTIRPRKRLPLVRTRLRSWLRVKRRARGKRNCLRSCVLRREFHCQPLATLLPAPAQYLPPPLIRHARPEPVFADSALVSRAVRWLSHYNSRRCRTGSREAAKPIRIITIVQATLTCFPSRMLTYPHYPRTFAAPLARLQ